MSQPPQEDVERLKQRLRFWKRFALASTSALVALFLAISGFVVADKLRMRADIARIEAERKKALEEVRQLEEEERRFDEAMQEVGKK